MSIEWRQCVQSPDYLVSSDGKVMRKDSGHILKPWEKDGAHLYVKVGKSNKQQVHRLVAFAFLGPPPEGHECRHLNGNPKDNRVENLAWGTRRQNIDDYVAETGRYPKSSIGPDVVVKIRSMYTGKHGEKRMIARALGITEHVVGGVLNGRTYGHIKS
jgi:hypothetical protein